MSQDMAPISHKFINLLRLSISIKNRRKEPEEEEGGRRRRQKKKEEEEKIGEI